MESISLMPAGCEKITELADNLFLCEGKFDEACEKVVIINETGKVLHSSICEQEFQCEQITNHSDLFLFVKPYSHQSYVFSNIFGFLIGGNGSVFLDPVRKQLIFVPKSHSEQTTSCTFQGEFVNFPKGKNYFSYRPNDAYILSKFIYE